jgi:catechol 2,3-dioxygenase
VPQGRRVGLYHLGIKIGDTDDELREAVARCKEADVRIIGLSDHTVSHSLYVLDPDGNELELYIDVPGVDWKNNPAAVMSPTRPLAL